MSKIIHVDLYFNPGVDPTQKDLDDLNDDIIGLLVKQFPNYFGTGMVITIEDEDK
jgi:hypothetical protein